MSRIALPGQPHSHPSNLPPAALEQFAAKQAQAEDLGLSLFVTAFGECVAADLSRAWEIEMERRRMGNIGPDVPPELKLNPDQAAKMAQLYAGSAMKVLMGTKGR